MKKKIIIKPSAGLSNRLRAIESALSLAADLRQPLEVVWVTDKQMIARFDEIFLLPGYFSITSEDKYKYSRSSFSLTGIKNILSAVVNFFYGIEASFSELDVPALLWSKKIDLTTYCAAKSCYFYTCQQFYPFRFNYSWLRPVPAIQKRVNDFSSRIAGRKCIGIHIRRTDNEWSISESPDTLFHLAIEKEIAEDANVVFFLATDDPKTEEDFIGRYGTGMILTNPKKFGRDTVAATQDAVVDLLSLTKCSKLYCSYWSSFSETAAVISGAEAVVVRSNAVQG